MKSTGGEHYIGLDHLRALAAFLVFTWHFIHTANPAGFPVTFDYVPALMPMSLLDEGHTGVSLFMTLSGYLFAKLLDGRSIHYGYFLFNRALRLLPLYLLVLALVTLQHYLLGNDLVRFAKSVVLGLVYPMLPNGGWSLTVEGHFYLLLHLLMWLNARHRIWLLIVLSGAIVLRAAWWAEHGNVQWLAYYTLIARIDQFVLGILCFSLRQHVASKHILATGAFAAFVVFFDWFDRAGGYHNLHGLPATKAAWVVMPSIEGLVWGVVIAWYDSSFKPPDRGVSRFFARLGTYSYSIYLLHLFVVFDAAVWIHRQIMDISNFYLALAWSTVLFVAMMIPGYLSFRYIESPFMRYRRNYVNSDQHKIAQESLAKSDQITDAPMAGKNVPNASSRYR